MGRTTWILMPLLAACSADDGGEAAPAGGGEEAPAEALFSGATHAATDGPGEVTVFWDEVGGADAARTEYRVFAGACPAPDLAGEPAAVVVGASRTTLTGLEGKLCVVVQAGETGADQVIEASADLPEVTAAEEWRVDLEYGAFSSPSLTDLDGDGVLDLVVGTGAEKVRGEVLALSGADGSELWRRVVTGEVVGSPALYDVNGDGVKDVLVGGRDVELWALDGRDGEQLWVFETTAWVASPAVLQAGDDSLILAAVGGLGPLREEGDPDFDRTNPEHHLDRWSPGRLYAVDANDGQLVGRMVTEEYEYYASPGIGDVDGDGVPEIAVGSGGHTSAGEILIVDIDDWSSRWSQPSGAKGVVASPLLADLDGDGKLDVVAASEDQNAAAYRGYDGEPLWRVEEAGQEFVSSPSAGWGLRKATPTVALAAALGTWTAGYEAGTRMAVDGATGDVLWRHETAERFLIATPLWADLTGNGLDDVIAPEIEFRPFEGLFFTRLKFLHGGTGVELGEVPIDASLVSTPTIADVDGDGELDLLWVGFQGPIDTRGALPGMAGRIGLGVPVPDRGVSWDRFRGNADNSGVLTTPPPRN